MTWVSKAPRDQGKVTARVKRLRGSAAVQRAKGVDTALRRARLANQVARVGMCAVCGRAPDPDQGLTVQAMAYRTVLCWKVLLCDRHVNVGCTAALTGRLRFYEVGPE